MKEASSEQRETANLLKLPTLETLLKYLPLLSLGLIAVGLIDSVLYYANFDINIISYLDASEIIFLPADRIILIGSAFGTVLVGFIPIVRRIDVYFSNLRALKVFYFKFSLVCLLSAVGLLFDSQKLNELLYDILYVLIYAINLSIISTALLQLNFSRDSIVTFGFLFITSLFLRGRVSAKSANIEKLGAKYSIQLTLANGDELMSSRSFVFIGKTKNYYFFRWLKPLNKTVVIPMSNVRQERISKLRDSI